MLPSMSEKRKVTVPVGRLAAEWPGFLTRFKLPLGRPDEQGIDQPGPWTTLLVLLDEVWLRSA